MIRSRLSTPKAGIRKIANRRYGTARAFYRTKLHRSKVGDPILIYSVGKVGSTSVAAALEDGVAPREVHHIHWLTDAKLTDARKNHREGANRYRGTDKSRRFFQRYVWVGEYLSREIAKGGRVWTVVTLVRDPVGRNVSSFFQNLESFFDFWPREELENRDIDEVAHQLVEMFLTSYVVKAQTVEADGDPLVWFDEELKEVFDVDVYASEFPTEAGFDTYSSDNAKVLLIRLEDLDNVASDALGPFLGVGDITMGRSNDSSDKTYADAYKRFRDLLVIPDVYLDRMYTSTYATHFYSESEIAAFRSRWTT